MAIETRNVRIDEDTWTFTTYSSTKGLKIFKSLMKVFGPPVSALLEKGEELDISKAVSSLVHHLDDVEIDTLIKDMIPDVRKNGKEIMFDMEFAANYGTLISLLTEVVKANFSSFFPKRGIADLLKTIANTQV